MSAATPNALAHLVAELEIEPPRPVWSTAPSRWWRTRALAVAVSILVLASAAVAARGLTRGASGAVADGREATARGPSGASGASGGSDDGAGSSGVEDYRGPGWITDENARPGSSEWIIPDDPKAWEKVRGYAGATSVEHGQAFTLYVSTQAPTWHADAYRMGYYGGLGARLIWSSGDLPGTRQPDPVVDPATRMAEARWDPSLEVHTGPEWPPGMYLVRLASSDGGATFVPMVVRDDASTAAVLVQSSVTTWQAYNGWGGANLYTGPANNPKTRAQVVSFDRPYGGNGSGEFFGREFEFAYWAERNGLDVTYWTDVDLNDRGELARQHKAVVSLGHDEYYSTGMRQSLEQARDTGVNLAFLGANAIFRKIRLEPSSLGQSRREVNYRVARDDPLYGSHNDQVTVSWRDSPSNEPESALVGNFYECNPVKADWVVADASAWMFEGTGFADGDRVPDMVGNEYDRVTPEVPTPANIQVVAHSPVTCRKTESYADSTYYTAPSGAGVFAIGTFGLIPKLKTECPEGSTNVDCKIQRMTLNLMRTFADAPAGEKHPSVNNLAKFSIAPGYLKGGRPHDDDQPDASATSTTTAPRPAPPAAPSSRPTTTTTRPPTTTTTAWSAPTTSAPPVQPTTTKP